MVIAGAVASLVIWLVRKGLPESPRWLAQQRRYPEVRQVMPAQGSFKDIWSPRYRSRTLMLVVMNFFQAIGFFGFGNWLPALLAGKGASITHSLLYAFFITLAYPLGSLLCSRYADKMENKWQIVLSCLVTVIFGSLFALQNNPVWLILCGFFITWSNAWLTYSYHSYQSEVFPTYIRGVFGPKTRGIDLENI